MAIDDEVIRAYEEEFGPGLAPRSNRGFWIVAGTLLVSGVFLIVEIFANRPLANTIGHAQSTLRRAEAAAKAVYERTGSFQEADAGAWGGRHRPVLPLGRWIVGRAGRRERVRVRHRVGRGRPGSAWSVFLHPSRRRGGPSLRRRDGVHRRRRALGSRPSLVIRRPVSASRSR